MKVRFVVPVLCALALPLISAAGPSPGSAGNPYSDISEKNPFRLNTPPPPPIFQPPPPVLPEIKVSGFVVNGKKVRALFASTPKDPKESPVYYDLAEGETDGILRLVKIDLNKEEADIVNSGVPMHVSLQENGFQVQEAKGAPGQPATPPRQMAFHPVPPLPAPRAR